MNLPFDPAALVRAARSRADLSQRALAERAGTSQSAVARIELGTTSPTADTLVRLLAAADHELVVRLSEASAAGVAATAIGRRVSDFFEGASISGVIAVYLFGSTARASRHSESDVDVAVLVQRSTYPRRHDRSELRVRLGARLIQVIGVNDVDLVVLNDLPPGFARKIVLDGVRLFCSDPEAAHAFSRDIQLRWADLAPFLKRAATIKLEALGRR